MSSLNIRRAIVWVLSIIIGLLGTGGILLVLGTTPEEFGIEAIVVVIALAIAVMIWLDKFLSAEILPD